MLVWDADMVVASVGEDKKISLWHKNGKSLVTVPVTWTNSSDTNEVTAFLDNFYAYEILISISVSSS